MPWLETHVEQQRMQFITDWLTGEYSLAELCREYQVSRKTGHKLVRRYEAEGLDGLRDRSRRPHHLANQMSDEVAARILRLRAKHATWGPRKLKAYLERVEPQTRWPASSSIGELLQREGLVVPRRARRTAVAPGLPLSPMDEPNQVWCADFKGWFLTGDGKRCHPFTLLDGSTRFLLRCQAVEHCDYDTVQPILEAAFREYGLPQALQSDNGPPFASPAPAGLSRLAVWLIQLDVRPQRIEPGKPQQNGRQERFHRTLKADTANPPAADRAAQQRRFAQFRREYNEERPHEALELQPPASRYHRSSQRFPRRAASVVYPDHWKVRRVRRTGCIYWENGLLPVNQCMIGEEVGLAPLGDPEDRYWQLYYRKYPMMVLDSWIGVWVPDKEADRLLKQYPVEEDWCW